MTIYSRKLKLQYFHKTTSGSHAIKIYDPVIKLGMFTKIIRILLFSIVILGILFIFNWYYLDTEQLLDLVVMQSIENKSFSSSKENYLTDKEYAIEESELNNFHRVRFVSIPNNTTLEKYNSNKVPKYFLAQVNNPIDHVLHQKLSEPKLISKGIQTSAETMALRLEQCEQYFNANHLTTGKQGTALDCYQQILILNPTNVSAKKGLNKIEQRYQQWAKTAINKGNFKKAHTYIKRLKNVNPKSIVLPKLSKLLKRSKTSRSVKKNTQRKLLKRSKTSRSVKKNTQRKLLKRSKTSRSVKKNTQRKLLIRSKTSRSVKKNIQRKLQSSNKKVVKKSSHTTRKTSKRCNDIFFQESLGIRTLTSEQKLIKKQYCK